MTNTDKIQALFDSQLVAVNIGPRLFGEALEKQNVEVVQVDWRPIAGGDQADAGFAFCLGDVAEMKGRASMKILVCNVGSTSLKFKAV